MKSATIRLGQEVGGAMSRSGVSQRDLARQIGMSHSSLCRKLSGQTAWTAEDVASVCEALGVEESQAEHWQGLAQWSRGERWSRAPEIDVFPSTSEPRRAAAPPIRWTPASADALESAGGKDVLNSGSGHRMLVRGHTMHPEIQDGDSLTVSPVPEGIDLNVLDGVLVAVVERNAGRAGTTVVIGRLELVGTSAVRLRKASAVYPAVRVPLERIETIYLILSATRSYANRINEG